MMRERERERSFEPLKELGERSIGIGAGAIGTIAVLVGLKLLIEAPTEHLRTGGVMLLAWGCLVVYMGGRWLEYLNQNKIRKSELLAYLNENKIRKF